MYVSKRIYSCSFTKNIIETKLVWYYKTIYHNAYCFGTSPTINTNKEKIELSKDK